MRIRSKMNSRLDRWYAASTDRESGETQSTKALKFSSNNESKSAERVETLVDCTHLPLWCSLRGERQN